MTIRFDDQVAIVTGAGAGLGRSHALGLAARGARVVVNDLGAETDGSGADDSAAAGVVEEIRAAGGEAMAHGADVSRQDEVADMVARTHERWGRVDILINNAGILRDKSYSKMTMEDFRKVLEVHLVGSAIACHAVWPLMREAGYGRVLLTASSSGLYGNFGQANYGAAKAGMVGLMNVLHLEGAKHDIHVNTLAPTAATRMTEALLPPRSLDLLGPETITPGVLFLVSRDAPSRVIMGAGGGSYAETRITETAGVTLVGEDNTPEAVAAAFGRIRDPEGAEVMPDAFSQTRKYALNAARALGRDIKWT